MKYLSIVLLCILSLVGLAQPKVVFKNEVPDGEFMQLLNKFPQSATQEGVKEVSTRIGLTLETVIPNKPNPGIVLLMHIFVSQEGSVEKLIVDLANTKGYNLDSLGKEITNALTKGITGWTLGKRPASKFSISITRFYGKMPVRREVRTSDSSAIDLKMALSVVDSAKIIRLYLNQLELTSVPDVIYRFPNLQELYLGGNELQSVSIEMARLPKLKQLDLHGNQLTNTSLTITPNKTLEILKLNENKLTDIPSSVAKCKNLQMLWLGGNSLSELGNSSFRQLKRVTDLNFYKSEIVRLPGGIKKMKRLMVLDLYYNKLTTLPKSVVRLRNLTQLAVSHNELTALPRKIYKLRNLHTLYAHHNRLSKLPENMGRLREMRILDLGYNWYTDFPNEITSFEKLEELDLSSNNFLEFPAGLLEIKHLDKLYLRGNPFVKSLAGSENGQLEQLRKNSVEVFH
jgi:Leucine-rich repeat (LRR) protein